jgi:hypothetical protein
MKTYFSIVIRQIRKSKKAAQRLRNTKHWAKVSMRESRKFKFSVKSNSMVKNMNPFQNYAKNLLK